MNELQDLIAELHAIDQRLVDYENRYGVLSETFDDYESLIYGLPL